MAPLIPLPDSLPKFLAAYNPHLLISKPFVTLTYAQSLDSKIASAPGQRTTISHLETKTMTHYIRSLHDAILVGSGTLLADDPGLNCRFMERVDDGKIIPDSVLSVDEVHTPRPVVLDPWMKWDYEGSKLEELYLKGEGKAPWIIVNDLAIEEEKMLYVQKNGGRVIIMKTHGRWISWDDLLQRLKFEGIDSLMVEGGANVINQLLMRNDLVDSLIVTIGSTFLGSSGVDVSPHHAVQLGNVTWWHGTTDAVMAANLQSSKQ